MPGIADIQKVKRKIAALPEGSVVRLGGIINWEYEPGYQMSEQKISDEAGVSRTPVREAFIQLISENLLEARPYRGTFVTRVNIAQVEEARFIRACLECEIAQIACAIDVSPFIEYARRNIAEQRDALLLKDMSLFLKLDDDLHEALYSACNRHLSWQVVISISSNYQRIRSALLNKPTLLDEHRMIIDAIETKDVDAATRAMRSSRPFI